MRSPHPPARPLALSTILAVAIALTSFSAGSHLSAGEKSAGERVLTPSCESIAEGRAGFRHRCALQFGRSKEAGRGSRGAGAPHGSRALLGLAHAVEVAPRPKRKAARPRSSPPTSTTVAVVDDSVPTSNTAAPVGQRPGSAPPSQPPLAITPPAVPAPAPPTAPDPPPAPSPGPIPPRLSATAPVPLRSLVVGIDGGHDEWWDETIAARAALGAAVTRHEWDPAEPVDSREGLVLAAASEVHTRIHALLGGNELGDPAHYRDWVLAFISRYGRNGSFWAEHPELDASRYAITSIELGNEPYFGEMSPSEYADTVRPTLERIAELGLPVKVILPSYIHGQNTAWIDTLYQRIPNLNSLFYAFADHPYWYAHHPAAAGDNGPFARLDTLRRRMGDHGAAAKPIFITEYGESTASCGEECVSEAVQAEHLAAMLDAVVARTGWKVEMLSFFQLHDWATNSPDRERQFGLLREDGTPKPSYSIIRSAMQRYRG